MATVPPDDVLVDLVQAEAPLGLVVVHALPVVAEALAMFFDHLPGLDVLGFATSADEAAGAIDRIRDRRPLTVLVSTDMPAPGEGLWLLREVRERLRPVVVIAGMRDPDPEAVAASRAAGADGFVDMRTDPGELVDALHTTAAAAREGLIRLTPPR